MCWQGLKDFKIKTLRSSLLININQHIGLGYLEWKRVHHNKCLSKAFKCLVWFNPLKCFFGSEGHVALDRNPGLG